jgi:thiamine-monophosphate kinase
MASSTSLSEVAAIDILHAELGRGAFGSGWLAKRGLVGIGDDAAVLPRLPGRSVWSIDTSAEGVHFAREWLSLEQAAARATTAAISDLAAMGAKPVAALCALTLPKQISRAELRSIARGQRTIAERHACPVIGGNLCRGERVEFTTTVLGSAKRPLNRNDSRSGDEVWLVGAVGMAAAGLRVLQALKARGTGPSERALDPAQRACVRAWREPHALTQRGQLLVGRARALIDVSDGLASEAGHVARASGVCVLLNEAALRQSASPALCAVAASLLIDPLTLMLYGGEDYALLATGPARKRPTWATPIGRVVPGSGAKLQPARGGAPRRLRGGFDHLRS